MIKRFILDGCPGAGKTTLIFGKSDIETSNVHYPSLTDLGFVGMPESAAKAFFELQKEGIDAGKEFDKFLERIVILEKDKYTNAIEGETYFYDRSFHHWIHFRKSAGVNLPKWYDEFNAQIRYSEPVFLLQPVLSFDMTKPGIGGKTRIFTIEDRLEAYKRSKNIYEDLGYKIIEIPVFFEEPETNNITRREIILKHIGNYK